MSAYDEMFQICLNVGMFKAEAKRLIDRVVTESHGIGVATIEPIQPAYRRTTQADVDAYLADKGLVAVPVKPTSDMLNKAMYQKNKPTIAMHYCLKVWSSMIKAAQEDV